MSTSRPASFLCGATMAAAESMCVPGEQKVVRVWSVNIDGKPVRVATIEHGERKPSMCAGCSAPCCRGALRPVLTESEFKARAFPTLFLVPPDWMLERVPRAQAVATLGMPPDGPCSFLDTKRNVCTAWPNCPEACMAYDCREDERDEIREFAQARARGLRE